MRHSLKHQRADFFQLKRSIKKTQRIKDVYLTGTISQLFNKLREEKDLTTTDINNKAIPFVIVFNQVPHQVSESEDEVPIKEEPSSPPARRVLKRRKTYFSPSERKGSDFTFDIC